jgi:beta-galactosidase
VYANCDEVELFLDEHSLGREPCSLEQKFQTEFEVVYAPGELRAVAYLDGKAVTEQAISTIGKPAQIHLITDQESIRADGFDLCYVTIEVLDDKGDVHPSANNNIFFTVQGPGEILAVGSSNPISEEGYIGNQRKVHHGRALVVIKSTATPGEITLTAQADGLTGAQIKITAEQ